MKKPTDPITFDPNFLGHPSISFLVHNIKNGDFPWLSVWLSLGCEPRLPSTVAAKWRFSLGSPNVHMIIHIYIYKYPGGDWNHTGLLEGASQYLVYRYLGDMFPALPKSREVYHPKLLIDWDVAFRAIQHDDKAYQKP